MVQWLGDCCQVNKMNVNFDYTPRTKFPGQCPYSSGCDECVKDGTMGESEIIWRSDEAQMRYIEANK